MKKNINLLGLLFIVALMILQPGAESSNYKVANKDNPGEQFDVVQAAKRAKKDLVIFDFYSDYCGPCRAISPHLERVAAKRSDVMIYKLDINRKGTRGIDWGSPLADQYGLSSIPAFQVYDRRGKLVAEGQEAQKIVYGLIEESTK